MDGRRFRITDWSQVSSRDDFTDNALVEKTRVPTAGGLGLWRNTVDQEREVLYPLEGCKFDGQHYTAFTH